MILLCIDLLSNALKNHSILGRFCQVFERLDSRSFVLLGSGADKRTAVIYDSGAQVSSSRGKGTNFSYM